MKKEDRTIWMGVVLRLFGGPPNGDCAVLRPNSGTSFRTCTFGRTDLCTWDADSIVLAEGIFDLTICKYFYAHTPEREFYTDPEAMLKRLVADCLKEATSALRQLSIELFDRLRAGGRKFDVFVAVETPAEEVRISLMPEFLDLCHQFGLAIEVYMDHYENGSKPKRKSLKSSRRKKSK